MKKIILLIILKMLLYFFSNSFASENQQNNLNKTSNSIQNANIQVKNIADNRYNIPSFISDDDSNNLVTVDANGHNKNRYEYVFPELDIMLISNKDLSQLLATQHIEDRLLFSILEKELKKNDFNRINGNYLGIKLFILILSFFASDSDNLLITNNKKITAEVLISTQMSVPICCDNMYLVIDDFMLEIKQGTNKIAKNILDNKIKFFCNLIKFVTSISLAYLAAIVETQAAGDGYEWLFSQVTSNNISLNIAYYFGRYSRLIFSLNLYGVFFNQLIDEGLYKTGVGYLFNAYPLPTKTLDKIIKQEHIKKMLLMIDQEDRRSSTENISNYIKSNNLNSSFCIVDMQNIILNNYEYSKIYNLFINSVKILFIGAITLFCGIAFKQVFSARLMLENFINLVGVHRNHRIYFNFKNSSQISCVDITNCIDNLDFTKINITNKQISKLLSSDDTVVLASILSGISTASAAAVILLTAFDSIIKISKNSMYKQSLKKVYFKKSSLSYLFCIITVPPLYYGLKIIIDTYPVAEKYAEFLDSIGKEQLLTTNHAITISIICIMLTIVEYIPFAANFPRSINYIYKKYIYKR